MRNIVQTASGDESFSTLVKAVNAAGLGGALSGKDQLTVFAPDNDAFNKIPKEELDKLLEDKEKLGDILKYHVVSGKVMSSDVTKMKKADTLSGGELSIKSNGGVKINDSKVTKADIECSNGVIHVIDSVLMPK